MSGEEEMDPETGMPRYPRDSLQAPAQMKNFRLRFAKTVDGEMALVIGFDAPTKPGEEAAQFVFMIRGEELAKFYQYVKKGIEGDSPSYVR